VALTVRKGVVEMTSKQNNNKSEVDIIEGDIHIFTYTTDSSSHSAWYSSILIIIYIPGLVTTVTITPAGDNNVVDIVG
jgi:hypothetical protein